MYIATGDKMTGDFERHEFKRVKFVAEDGRLLFEMSVGRDEVSIEVAAYRDMCIYPKVSNVVVVSVEK